MDRQILGFILGIAAASAGAQTPSYLGSGPDALPGSELVQLTDGGPSIPLKHGGLLNGTENVILNGQALRRDADYAVDYTGGVIYLMKVVKKGDSLLVTYRYSTTAVPTATSSAGNPFNGFKLDLLPGALNMQFGFGQAERGANGSISRSNVFAWNNNFTMRGGSAGVFRGGTGLTGIVVIDDHQSMVSHNNFGSEGSTGLPGSGSPAKGQSNLILQNLQTGFLGGVIVANYQEVSKDFAAFGNASGAGQDTVARLQKERGLKRQGFGLQDVSVLGLKVTDTYHNVTDTNGGISWREFGMKEGRFNLGWTDQKVDKGFTRFDDLAEANRADLKRGVGLDRQTQTIGYLLGKNPAAGALNYQALSIEDPNGGHIYRRDGSFASKLLTLDFGDQQTETKFTNFANLTDAEKPVYQLDGGLRRQWFSLKSDFGRGYTPLSLSQRWIQSDAGQFVATDAAFGGKGWSLAHSERSSSPGFNSFGSISGPDTDGHIAAIAAMYGPNDPMGRPNTANLPAEHGNFAALAGVDRRFDSVQLQPGKDLTVNVGRLSVQGSSANDGLSLETLSLANKKYKLTVRDQEMDSNFTQLPQMLNIERQNLGTIAGLKRLDLGFNADLGKGQGLSYSFLGANAGDGSGLGQASREVLDFRTKTFDVAYSHRDVSNAFSRVNELVDPENNTLAQLVGHDQTDLKFKGTVLGNWKVDGQYYIDSNATLKQSANKNSLNVGFENKTTSLGFAHLDQKSNDPLQVLLGQVTDSFTLSQKFGSALKMHIAEADSNWEGTQTVASTGLGMVSSHSQTVGMEYKLNTRTNVASELTDTSYGNGQHAMVRNDSISQSFSKRLGLTLSQSVIDNPNGQKNVQTKRNYGFWYDLGKGMVLNYGYVRQLDTAGFATLNSIVSLGQSPAGSVKPDQLGATPTSTLNGLNFAGGYAANQWETPGVAAGSEVMRTQAFSNIRLSTAKPMKFGLVHDFNFNFAYDTAADNYNWIRENRAFAMSGKYGMTGFGYEYKSQIDSVGDAAIDRTFLFTTDTSAKKFISASVNYKVRTLPDSVKSLVQDKNVMIRNYDFTIRPTDKISLSSQLITNPEQANNTALLGSVTQGTRVDRWKLNYASTKSTDFGASWEESINESSKAVGQTAGFNLTLFKDKSPVKFFYGFENLFGNVPHHSTERWSFEFDQAAGPNKSLNIFVGNVNYGFDLNNGQFAHNLTMRFDYVWKF